jgi:hypothetical protein
MTNKHDFTGKSIKCDTWEQMLHLAKLAKLQGAKKHTRFSPDYFSFGNKCFVLENEVYDCCARHEDYTQILYSDFANPTEVVEVTGCDGCMFVDYGEYGINDPICSMQTGITGDIFNTCPLKKASITIKLKHND